MWPRPTDGNHICCNDSSGYIDSQVDNRASILAGNKVGWHNRGGFRGVGFQLRACLQQILPYLKLSDPAGEYDGRSPPGFSPGLPSPGRFPSPGRKPLPGRFPSPGRFPLPGRNPLPGRFPSPGRFPLPGDKPGLPVPGFEPGIVPGRLPGEPGWIPGRFPLPGRKPGSREPLPGLEPGIAGLEVPGFRLEKSSVFPGLLAGLEGLLEGRLKD